jgi:hypothetical protein
VVVSHSSHRSSVTDARVGRGDVTFLFIASRHTVPDMSSSATRIQLQVKQRPFGHHGHEMSEVNAAEPLPLIHADGYDDIHFHPRERPASSPQYTVCPLPALIPSVSSANAPICAYVIYSTPVSITSASTSRRAVTCCQRQGQLRQYDRVPLTGECTIRVLLHLASLPVNATALCCNRHNTSDEALVYVNGSYCRRA